MELLWYAASNVSVETGEVMMLQRTPTKVRATQTRIATTLIAIVLIAAWSGFVQPRLFAQTTTQTQNSVSDSSASPKPNAPCPASAGNGEQRSSVKITERTYEEGTEAFHPRRKSSHLEAASFGEGARLGAV